VYTDASAVGTWALWQIELSSAEEAQYFDSALSGRFLVRHATQGTRVYAVLGSTSLGSTELEEWGKTWIAESE
jgi:hypothetical protein